MFFVLLKPTRLLGKICVYFNDLCSVIDEYDNPEYINTRPEFAPSKRLIDILSKRGEKYDKVNRLGYNYGKMSKV